MAESTPLTLGGLAGAFAMGRTNRGSGNVDQAMVRLERQINRFADLVEGAANRSRTSGGPANGGGPTQQSRQTSNGGGWSVGGFLGGQTQPTGGSHRAPGSPSVLGGSGPLGNGQGARAGVGMLGQVGQFAAANPAVAAGVVGAGAAVGAGYLSAKALNSYTSNHAEAQIANEFIARQATPGNGGAGSGLSWGDNYKTMFGRNYSASSGADLSSSQYALSQRGGFAVGSASFAGQSRTNAATSVLNPMVSNTQATTANLALGSVGSYNRMQGLGISTMNSNGQVDPFKIAKQILDKVPGSKNIRTPQQLAAAFGPAGGITVTIQGMVSNGYIPASAVEVVVETMKGILKAQLGGMSSDELAALTKTAATHKGDAQGDNARNQLKKIGIDDSLISRNLEKEGLGREKESETITGFVEGMQESISILNKFNEALNGLFRIPGVGEAVGYGSGVSGILSKAGGAIGSIGSGISSVVGMLGDGPPNMAGSATSYGGAAGANSARAASTVTTASSGSAGSSTSRYNLGAVKPWVAKAAEVIGSKFGIKTVYGVGSRPNVSDHPKGLATDFMCDSSTGAGLSRWVVANASALNVTYVIWQQRIWSVNNPSWKQMEDRGSPTANHMDHVHVSYLASPANNDMGTLTSGAGGASTGNGDSTTSAGSGAPAAANRTSVGGSGIGGVYSELAALSGGASPTTGYGSAGSGGGSAGAASGGSSMAGALGGGTRVGTINLDWAIGNDKKQLKDLAGKFDVLMIQEANKTDLSKALPKGWKSNQDMSNHGTMGSAIAWNASKLGDSIGQSGMAFGSNQKGGNTRFISYIDSEIDGKPVRLISGHVPLTKYADPKIFEKNLKDVIGSRPDGSEWLIGIDGNSLWKGMGKRLGGVQSGSGVVGQIRSPGLSSSGSVIDSTGMRKGLTDHAAVGQSIGAGVGGTSAASGTRAIGQQMAQARGWGDQWDALNNLWTRESGWRVDADNPGSSAYGIPQALVSGRKMPKGYFDSGSGTGKAFQGHGGDASVQIKWGLDYIAQRYGDPKGAWDFWQKNNWYAKGSWDVEQDQDARIHRREMILPATIAEAVRAEFNAPSRASSTGGGGITFTKDSIHIHMDGSSGSTKDMRRAGELFVEAVVKDERMSALAGGTS